MFEKFIETKVSISELLKRGKLSLFFECLIRKFYFQIHSIPQKINQTLKFSWYIQILKVDNKYLHAIVNSKTKAFFTDKNISFKYLFKILSDIQKFVYLFSLEASIRLIRYSLGF